MERFVSCSRHSFRIMKRITKDQVCSSLHVNTINLQLQVLNSVLVIYQICSLNRFLIIEEFAVSGLHSQRLNENLSSHAVNLCHEQKHMMRSNREGKHLSFRFDVHNFKILCVGRHFTIPVITNLNWASSNTCDSSF